jgi:hypothetical protein
MGPTSSMDTLLPAVCQRSGSIARWLGKANLFSRLIRGGRWQNRGVAQPIFEQVEKSSNKLEDKTAFARSASRPCSTASRILVAVRAAVALLGSLGAACGGAGDVEGGALIEIGGETTCTQAVEQHLMTQIRLG